MRQWSVRNGFDFLNVQDSKVRLPLMKSIERIVIRTEIFPKACTSNRLLEHPTESLAVDNSWIPNPMIRRVFWSMTTNTQYVRNATDSKRIRSRLQKLSFMWPRNVSQDGPSPFGTGW